MARVRLGGACERGPRHHPVGCGGQLRLRHRPIDVVVHLLLLLQLFLPRGAVARRDAQRARALRAPAAARASRAAAYVDEQRISVPHWLRDNIAAAVRVLDDPEQRRVRQKMFQRFSRDWWDGTIQPVPPNPAELVVRSGEQRVTQGQHLAEQYQR